MAIGPIERLAIGRLSVILYDFLPASGNSNTSFPLAAQKVGLGEYWEHNSKKAAIAHFIERVLLHKSNSLISFFDEVVVQSIQWRGNGARPLSREEIDTLNEAISSLGYRSMFLTGQELRAVLPRQGTVAKEGAEIPAQTDLTNEKRAVLSQRFIEITRFEPQRRGFEFERFLTSVFKAYGMTPNSSFRLCGEQIDGSFEHYSNTYLMEAKWVSEKIGQTDLLAFKGKVDGKSTWSRGLLIAVNGFSDVGLAAFATGKSTNIVCMDGLDLHLILEGQASLGHAISAKTRKAAETNRAFVSLRELL